MTDSASQALLHQWFPDLYAAPDVAAPAASAPGAPAPQPIAPAIPGADAIIANSIGANGNSGAFDGAGSPSPGGAPGGAFSSAGSPNTNASPGTGAFGGRALSTIGNLGLGIGQNFATNAISAATGIPSAGIGAGINVGKSLYDAIQADQALSQAAQPGLTMGEVVGNVLGSLDPTQGIASAVNGLAGIANSILGTDLSTAHQGVVNSITGGPSLSDIASMANATANAQATAQSTQDLNDAATAFHDMMAGTANSDTGGVSGTGDATGNAGTGASGSASADAGDHGISASGSATGDAGAGASGGGSADASGSEGGGGDSSGSGGDGHDSSDGGGGDARGGLIRGAFDQTPHLAGPQHIHPAIPAALQAQFINRNRGAFG